MSPSPSGSRADSDRRPNLCRQSGVLAGVFPPNDETPNHRGPESDHPGGVFAAMVDSHVVWVADAVNPAVYLAAFTRAGGEVPGDDF